MLEIEIKGTRKQIPSLLDECSSSLLLTYIQLFGIENDAIYSLENGELKIINQEAYDIATSVLLYKLLGLKWKEYKNIPAEERTRLIYDEKLLDFFFTDYLTENKIESIGRWKKLYGPIRQFHQLTFEEFRHAYTKYSAFIDTGEEEHLNYLLAILYRPAAAPIQKQDTGDSRQPFNLHKVDGYLPVATRQKPAVKLAVLKYFTGNMQLLKENYPLPFTPSKHADKRDGGTDFLDTALTLSTEAQETLNAILQENVYLAFKRITRLIQKAKEIEAITNDTK